METIKIEDSPEPDYPKLGEPLLCYEPKPRSKHREYWCGHIILEVGRGIFLPLGFDSELKALEYSANYLVEIRTNGQLLGIF